MSHKTLFLAQLWDRPAALERFLGLVRRRALALERLAVRPGPPGILELYFHLDESRTSTPRLVAELEGLLDLVRLERLGGAGESVTATVEFTGSPDQVAGVLGALRHSGVPFLVARGGPSTRGASPPSTHESNE